MLVLSLISLQELLVFVICIAYIRRSSTYYSNFLVFSGLPIYVFSNFHRPDQLMNISTL